MMIKKLQEVIYDIDFELVNGKINLDLLIYNINSNSKKTIENSIFVALDGSKFRGIDYLVEAIDNGAKVCFIPFDCPPHYYESYKDVVILKAHNLQYILSKLLSNFYANQIPQNIITITGTNGKSSICLFMSQMLSNLGISNMVIGTLGVFINDFNENSNNQHHQLNENLTTPSAEKLWEYLHYAYCNNIKYVLMESSSHGILQHRVSNINFKCIGFSNLSQDHLDYHKNMDNYFNAKAQLFINNNKALSLINVDDEWGEKLFLLLNQSNPSVKSYGYIAEDIKLVNIQVYNDYQVVSVIINDIVYDFKLFLLGEFQVYNVLCALGLLYYNGINLESLLSCIDKIVEIEGRLNLVKHPSGGKIFIDFAHTPNALLEVLKVLKKDNPSKLKVLFGCGGNRDTTKRSIMGSIASEYCDEIYVSDDNPRYEDPKEIRKQIIDGILSHNKNQPYIEIGDRRDAIELALKNLQENETLLIAGKGHEEGQQIKDEYIEFNDKKIVKKIIESLKC